MLIELTVLERISCGQQLSKKLLHTDGSSNLTPCLLFSPEKYQCRKNGWVKVLLYEIFKTPISQPILIKLRYKNVHGNTYGSCAHCIVEILYKTVRNMCTCIITTKQIREWNSYKTNKIKWEHIQHNDWHFYS